MHRRYGTPTGAVAQVGARAHRPGRRPTDPSLSSTVRRHEHAVVIDVRGTLCAVTASTLHDAVLSTLASRPSQLVLDLDGVSCSTPAGWWVLHAVADQALRVGVTPIATVPNPRLRARLVSVAACGLRVAGTLPAMGEPSESAEPPRVTPPAAASLSGWDIDELLHRYGAALVGSDAATASRCHTEPTFVTDSRSVVTFATHDEVRMSLTRLAASYRDAGLVSARHALETVTLINEQYCGATVLWCHGGEHKRSSVHARYHYLLRRVPHGLATGSTAVRINTVTLLDGPRLAPRDK